MLIKNFHFLQLFSLLFLLNGTFACSSKISRNPPKPNSESISGVQIAFMPDVHFHDIYAEFNDFSFQGLPNSSSGKNATIRTLSSELNSTRLFNENYFALLAALDDVVARGIKLVALPGDFSDNGQQVHMRGLNKILSQYQQQYGIEFFATPGNHDPVRPFVQPAGKADYLGQGGQPQRIFSKGAEECQNYLTPWTTIANDQGLSTICSEEVKELGYVGIMDHLSKHGFYPQPSYRYWETPYSHYSQANYDYKTASIQSDLSQRQYQICQQASDAQPKAADVQHCTEVPDSSYLVEPVEGLWLLAIDANVYVPKSEGFDVDEPQNPNNFVGSGNAGYNLMFSHKSHVINWIKDVVKRADKAGKKLIAFSHFPMSEFYDGQSEAIGDYFGLDNFQLARKPLDKISQALAATGLKVHVGGHMHINDTGFTRGQDGQFLFNIQAPSIAAYVPAYKILTVQPDANIEVQTIVLNEVRRFNELFEHYQQEHEALTQSGSAKLWNKDVLSAKNYREFANWHITELTRQRFLPQEWPQDVQDLLFNLSGQDMLILSQLSSNISLKLLAQPSFVQILQQSNEWQTASQKAVMLAKTAGYTLGDFADWNGFDLAVDFYRLRNAGQLALDDIQDSRLTQYRLLTAILLAQQADKSAANDNLKTVLAQHFGPIFNLLQQFTQGLPDKHFLLNMGTGTIDGLE